jgi:hypothetical protein
LISVLSDEPVLIVNYIGVYYPSIAVIKEAFGINVCWGDQDIYGLLYMKPKRAYFVLSE